MKYVLFDLDGTLLPMDQDVFVNGYFGFLVQKMAPRGYEARKLIETIWAGTAAMVKNDGTRTNEEAFWDCFVSVFGPSARDDVPLFEEFYAEDFQRARAFCGFAPEAAEIIALVKEKGAVPVLATNPLFPAVATRSRIRWAGLSPEDFALYTTYENISWCKPDPGYYREILRRLDAAPEDCMMIGNDVQEDMIAAELGLEVFLLTDCMINRSGADIVRWPHGSFPELKNWLLQKLP